MTPVKMEAETVSCSYTVVETVTDGSLKCPSSTSHATACKAPQGPVVGPCHLDRLKADNTPLYRLIIGLTVMLCDERTEDRGQEGLGRWREHLHTSSACQSATAVGRSLKG